MKRQKDKAEKSKHTLIDNYLRVVAKNYHFSDFDVCKDFIILATIARVRNKIHGISITLLRPVLRVKVFMVQRVKTSQPRAVVYV